MNHHVLVLALIMLNISCHSGPDKEKTRKEIFQSEKAFEKMVSEKGMEEAFYYYADENAVIKRENDTIIKGKENIRKYYNRRNTGNVTLNWTPDFIEVADCGTLGYTYGKYVYKLRKETGDTVINKGIFHTIWKKQEDNSWKFVWD